MQWRTAHVSADAILSFFEFTDYILLFCWEFFFSVEDGGCQRRCNLDLSVISRLLPRCVGVGVGVGVGACACACACVCVCVCVCFVCVSVGVCKHFVRSCVRVCASG